MSMRLISRELFQLHWNGASTISYRALHVVHVVLVLLNLRATCIFQWPLYFKFSLGLLFLFREDTAMYKLNHHKYVFTFSLPKNNVMFSPLFIFNFSVCET